MFEVYTIRLMKHTEKRKKRRYSKRTLKIAMQQFKHNVCCISDDSIRLSMCVCVCVLYHIKSGTLNERVEDVVIQFAIGLVLSKMR